MKDSRGMSAVIPLSLLDCKNKNYLLHEDRMIIEFSCEVPTV
jgi:hypothetical protein